LQKGDQVKFRDSVWGLSSRRTAR